jgi:hypothetical protein
LKKAWFDNSNSLSAIAEQPDSEARASSMVKRFDTLGMLSSNPSTAAKKVRVADEEHTLKHTGLTPMIEGMNLSL